MSTQQFDIYAKFYDLLYKDKNYNVEAAYIHELIKRQINKTAESISLLDLACGTGKHLFELSNIGYKTLSGSDISAPMIEIAKKTSEENKKSIQFYNYSFQEANKIARQHDVVISMFSAINYLTSFSDQLKSFKNINGLLNDSGIFIFDYWNGNAVARDYSPVKVLRKKVGEQEIMRVSNTHINAITQDVSVKFSCLYFEDGKTINEFEEVHHLHYYHFSEMYNLLEMSGFEVLHMSPFNEPDKPIEPYDWNISIVARKRLVSL